ncbi:MAG: YlxR family protein [Caldisericia bacterium]|nr:YlxR family protein [Caldisericia bacterium]
MNLDKDMKEILRRCISCKKQRDKKEFLRIVKTKNMEIFFDPYFKLFGRSAYICKDEKCIKNAFSKKRLEKALRISQIDPELKIRIKKELLEYIKEVKNEKVQSF